MATELYTKVRYRFETAHGGCYYVEPDLPDGAYGYTPVYEAEGLARVTFSRDLKADELAECVKRGAVLVKDGKPEFSDEMRTKAKADAEAVKAV